MRSSRADDRSGRESVFIRPAHLDDVVARIQAGESFADEDEEDGRYERRSRYGAPRSDRSSSVGDDDGRGSGAGGGATAAAIGWAAAISSHLQHSPIVVVYWKRWPS